MLVTASQLDRIARCPASAALPQIHVVDEDAKAPERGIAVHSYLERYSILLQTADQASARTAALAEVDEQWRGVCADIDLELLRDLSLLTAEPAVAYNWRDGTARRLYPAERRAYDVDEACEIPMTSDVVGIDERAGVVHVGDYKGPHAWLPQPDGSYQLVTAALAWSRLYRVRAARVEYVRILDDGRPVRWSSHIDAIGLATAAIRVRDLMESLGPLRASVLAGVVPDVTAGRWCRYCPSSQHCPSTTALVRAALSSAPLDLREPLTPATAKLARERLEAWKLGIKPLEAALHAYAKLNPIPVGADEDGAERWWGELERPGNDRLDGAIVHRVLTEIYDGAAANGAVTMEATKKAITDVVRAKLEPGDKITHAVERVINRVRELGGITNPPTRTTTEYTVAANGETRAARRKT